MSAEPARRFVLAQSWWIASEVVRRQPHLRIVETQPGGGQYDCLTVYDPGRDNRPLLDLNRNGTMHAHVSGFDSLEWSEAIAAANAHDVVRKLERATGFTATAKAPASGPAVLTYRVFARVLTSMVDDRHAWDARNGRIDSVGTQRAEMESFPTVVEGLRDRRPSDLFGVSAYRYWILLRDTEPLAVLDTDGLVHMSDRTTELLPTSRASHRSLTVVIAQVLGSVLP